MSQTPVIKDIFIGDYDNQTHKDEFFKEELHVTHEDITIKQEPIEVSSGEQNNDTPKIKEEMLDIFEDISVKQEPTNIQFDATDLKKTNVTKEAIHKILNANTIATNSNISTEIIGKFEVHIPDIADDKGGWLTRYSEDNKLYHIKSGPTGQFMINTNYQHIKASEQDTFFIRSVLIKKNSVYRVYPVNRICDKHSYAKNYYENNNPIQAAIMTPKCEYSHSQTLPRSSMIHWCNPPNHEGTIKTSINLMFPCNDTCPNSTYSHILKNMEASRDLKLIQTLEVLRDNNIQILARHCTDLWIKSNICARDLIKTERRKPKGSLSHHKTKRQKVELNSDADSVAGQREVENIKQFIDDGKINKQNAPFILERINHIREKLYNLIESQ